MTNGMISAGPTLENRISGSPNCASSAAIVMSHIITSSQPPPRQWPCTEAMTGLRMSHGVISRATSSVSDSCQASALPLRAARAGLGLMSYPAENDRPSARSTTTLVAGSRSASCRRSTSLRLSSGLIALSLSPRLSVTIPILPSVVYSTRSGVIKVSSLTRARDEMSRAMRSHLLVHGESPPCRLGGSLAELPPVRSACPASSGRSLARLRVEDLSGEDSDNGNIMISYANSLEGKWHWHYNSHRHGHEAILREGDR